MSPNYNEDQEIQLQEGSLAEKAFSQKFDFNLWMQEMMHNAPWWGISLAAHVFFIIFLAALPSTGGGDKVEEIQVINMKEDKKEEVEKIEEEIEKEDLEE